ncbi:hypothetical protein PXK01_09480 [Phaeobacter sp. PT47_59]|uniref:hypothetical protein n=1 Tax=Phaeobacter sp. PT47_59 TaxID=3029979 RepID=UPI0023804A6C|nr:hypothetical protein [Phaeobacter sp. PT47_59]MDE4174387.1 hypothetical protein [Phaeobacter sp. PT47_59]
MDSDLAIVLGFFLGCLAVLSLVSAYSDGRWPRLGALLLVISAGFILYAARMRPGGYRLEELPEVFFSVLGRFS